MDRELVVYKVRSGSVAKNFSMNRSSKHPTFYRNRTSNYADHHDITHEMKTNILVKTVSANPTQSTQACANTMYSWQFSQFRRHIISPKGYFFPLSIKSRKVAVTISWW
ncbi:hypothetical protein EAF04_001737 [Stromatinia cepivora]|nr:hypothetical protein EAF04_001737 [Stromatinia cepivora]